MGDPAFVLFCLFFAVVNTAVAGRELSRPTADFWKFLAALLLATCCLYLAILRFPHPSP